ncbi:MAG: DUF1127 domain-containing protein [Magnetovibrio sp.]|nr:DUF1127 domain-containing protein [Magnetovibrio sp.]
MTTLTFNHLPSGNAFVAKASKLLSLAGFDNVMAYIRREMAVRAAVVELQQLDDRCLADIGITRGEITGVVRGNFKNSA